MMLPQTRVEGLETVKRLPVTETTIHASTRTILPERAQRSRAASDNTRRKRDSYVYASVIDTIDAPDVSSHS